MVKFSFERLKVTSGYLHDAVPVVAGGDAEKGQPRNSKVGERRVTPQALARVVLIAD